MRDYDTPDLDDRDAWESRTIEGQREEAALIQWEQQRGDAEAEYAEWLRREEYGDQDAPDLGEAA